MITTINNKLNFSSEQEQSQACLNSAEHEKNQGRKVLNVPNKREQNQTCLDSAESEGLRPKGNVPNLRFPEFQGEWEKCTLEDVMNFSTTRVNSSELNEDNYVSTENMLQDYQGIVDAKSVPEDVNVISFSCGDILISNIRPYLKKIWKATYNGGCSSDVFVLKANDNIESDYLHYIIANDKFINFVMSGAKGVKMPRGDKNQMKTYCLSLPQIQEQKKIATLLRLIDERIVTQNKIIEDLKKLKSAVIDYAINSLNTDFAKFGSLYEMAGEGGTPTTSNASFYDNGKIPFIKIDDLKKKYLTENKDFITEMGLRKSSAWLVPTRSILFSNGATIGEISITTYPVCTKQGILGIVPKQNIDVEFLYYFMSSSYFKKAVSRIVTEGTMKTAYLKDINNILCPIPTKEKQQEIAKMPSALNSKIDFEQSILKLFCSQKQYLLRQMFI